MHTVTQTLVHKYSCSAKKENLISCHVPVAPLLSDFFNFCQHLSRNYKYADFNVNEKNNILVNSDIMELPHLGSHCHFTDCNRLDFLPMKCRGCSESFCSEHFGLEIHNCAKSGIVDRQVPTCPLCNKPVPLGISNKPPDQIVNDHIDRNCDSQAAAKKRAKKKEGRCCAKKCKTKELIPIFCELCKRPVCLKHRFPKDHDCLQNKNNGLSDQEAMAKAIKLSIQDQPGSTTKLEEARRAQQEALDKAIAQRLQRYESQRQRRTQQQTTSSRSEPSRDCSIQ